MPSSISSLYQGIANIYKESQEYDLQAIALEKALEFTPNDITVRFNMAYAYSKVGREELSLLHYTYLLKYDPDNAGAQNNIAVQYGILGMNIKSIDFYKKSFSGNNTLAGSNLAYKLIDIGFAEEAEHYLEEAQKQEDVHTNVGTAIGKLFSLKNEEEEKEDLVLKDAYKQQK